MNGGRCVRRLRHMRIDGLCGSLVASSFGVSSRRERNPSSRLWVTPDLCRQAASLRQPWRKAYAAELAEYPRLLAMLDGNGGVDAVYNAAGVTPEQREAIEEVQDYGGSLVWAARSLGIPYERFRKRHWRGIDRLRTWIVPLRVEGDGSYE